MDGKTSQRSEFSDRPCGRCAGPKVAQQLVGWQTEGIEAGRYSGGASVEVVEATDLGLSHDFPPAGWLYLARPGSVAIEGLMGP